MRKYNEKGFTLIELLAVIAILAIIALITTPAILNVIEDARVKGTEDKAWGTIDAVKQTYSQSGLKADFDSTNVTAWFSNAASKKAGGYAVQMSGESPSAGYVAIDVSTGKVIAKDLRFTQNGTYTCSTNTDGTKMCCQKGTATVTCS